MRPTSTSGLDAEVAELLLAIQRASDACLDADYLGPEKDPDLEIFRAAVRHLRHLEAKLNALLREMAGGRYVHTGTRTRH
jgi:hypothetical protein